jgi:excisionase family DNA binding protein
MAKKILTVSELAEHLNVHRITIYRLLKSGSLPGFKIGRVWRFDLDEIGRWMADGKSTQAMRAATDGDGDGHLDGHGDAKTDGHLDGHGDAKTDGHIKRSPSTVARKPSAASEQGRAPQPKR